MPGPSRRPRPHAPTTVAGQPMTYDPNGNLVSGRGRSYDWNVDNKPTTVNGVSLAYAGDGTRLTSESGMLLLGRDTGSAGYFVYCGGYDIRKGLEELVRVYRKLYAGQRVSGPGSRARAGTYSPSPPST